MKKFLLILLSIILLGGVAFAVTQSDWLKGTYGQDPGTGDYNPDGTLTPPGGVDPAEFGSSGNGIWDQLGVGNTGGTGTTDPTLPGGYIKPGGNLPGPGTGTNTQSTYVIYLIVEDQNGDYISGLADSAFSSEDGDIFEAITEISTYYEIEVPSETTYNVKVEKDGYITTSGDYLAHLKTDVIIMDLMELPYSHIVTVKDDSSSVITGATVLAGPSLLDLDSCTEYQTGTFGCAIPADSTSKGQYSVSASGYMSEMGSFSTTYTSASTSPVTADVVLSESPVVVIPTPGSIDITTVTYSQDADLLLVEVCLIGTEGVPTSTRFAGGISTPTGTTTPIDEYHTLVEGCQSFNMTSVSTNYGVTTEGTYGISLVANATLSGGDVIDMYGGTFEYVDNSEPTTYVDTCNSLTLTPASYELSSSETSVPTINLAVDITGTRTVASFWARLWASILLADESSWTGSLVLQSSGSGTFTDEDGNTGSPLSIDVNGDTVTISATYANGAVGDTLTAYVSGSTSTCSDTLTITQASAPAPADTDADDDGLDDTTEATLGTDPNDPDTDDDGLTDYEEVYTYGTNPLDADSDDDGLEDGEEVDTYDTDPLDADSDNGGIEDGDEVTAGTDPNDGSDDYSTDDDTSELDLGALDSTEDCEEDYQDVEEDDWFGETVCRLTDAGFVEGRVQYSSYSLFYPDDEITKAEVLKLISLILLDLDESDAQGKTSGFTDPNLTTEWFYWAVLNLEDENVIRTIDAGTIGNFNSNITRGELAVYIARALGLTSYSFEIEYSDVDEDDWFAYAVALLSRTDDEYVKDMLYDGTDEELPVIEGYSDGTFEPYDEINRAEALTMVYRAYQIYIAD